MAGTSSTKRSSLQLNRQHGSRTTRYFQRYHLLTTMNPRCKTSPSALVKAVIYSRIWQCQGCMRHFFSEHVGSTRSIKSVGYFKITLICIEVPQVTMTCIFYLQYFSLVVDQGCHHCYREEDYGNPEARVP